MILAIVSNLAQYTYWRSTTRTGSTWRRLGPTILLLAAIPLATADPLRHVLQDSGVWSGPSSSMYRPGCSPVSGLHGFWCLSVTGWIFQLATWTGFALMISGIVWQADLIPKLRAAWRDIKRARARGRTRQTVGDGAV